MRGIRGVETGFEIGEDWVERGAERDEKTVGAFAVSFPVYVAFPEARDDPAQVVAVAADVAAFPEVLCPGAGVSRDAPARKPSSTP